MICDQFLDAICVDTALEDTAEDEFAHPVLKAMAWLSIGTDPELAFAAAAELAAAIHQLASDEAQARQRIAEMLGRPGCDYQRMLFYTFAGRGLYSSAPQLHGLVRLLKARRDMWCALRSAGRKVTTYGTAYVAPQGEGPVGQFASEFVLSAPDRAFIRAEGELDDQERGGG